MQSTIPYTPSVLAPYTFTEINPMALQGYSSAHTREVDPQNKRQRISMACKFCRRRKIRCCGGEPCKNCEKSGKACDYEPVPDEVNKATRQKKAMSRAARAPTQTPAHQQPPPPPYYGVPAPVYDTSYLAVPTAPRLGHRRSSSAPDFWNLNNQHHVPQQHTVSSPLMYDNSNQWTAPHTTQGWVSNDMNNVQYDQSVMPQVPDYQTYQAAPEAYSSYSSWSSNDTQNSMQSNGSHHSTHSGISHTGMTPSMSVPDLSQYMSVPVHPIHPGHNPLTPRHPHQSLSIDSSSTLSSVPTMSSPNTPAYYSSGEQYSGPSADLSFPTAFGSMGINNHSTSPTLAPEYKHPKDLVGLGISQQSNHTTPTQRNPLQPSIMEPSLSDQFYVAY